MRYLLIAFGCFGFAIGLVLGYHPTATLVNLVVHGNLVEAVKITEDTQTATVLGAWLASGLFLVPAVCMMLVVLSLWAIAWAVTDLRREAASLNLLGEPVRRS